MGRLADRRLSWIPALWALLGLALALGCCGRPLGPATGEGPEFCWISGEGTQLAVSGFTTERSSRGVRGLGVESARLKELAGMGEKEAGGGWRELMGSWGG